MDGFDKEKALTKENLASFMDMLSFGKNEEGQYDTRIQGLGLDYYVSKVQNTELKSANVSKNIPTVAEVTQGEVITFAAKAVDILRQVVGGKRTNCKLRQDASSVHPHVE